MLAIASNSDGAKPAGDWRNHGNDAGGAPMLTLHGGAKARLDALTPPGHAAEVHVTLTDDHPWAQAFVIIEARPLAASSGEPG